MQCATLSQIDTCVLEIVCNMVPKFCKFTLHCFLLRKKLLLHYWLEDGDVVIQYLPQCFDCRSGFPNVLFPSFFCLCWIREGFGIRADGKVCFLLWRWKDQEEDRVKGKVGEGNKLGMWDVKTNMYEKWRGRRKFSSKIEVKKEKERWERRWMNEE